MIALDTECVAISIVNWRTPDLLENLLKSLIPQLSSRYKVYVVDNDSGDGSVEQLRTLIRSYAWEERVRLIEAERNGGFAAGNNIAINCAKREVDPKYFVLLNPDTLAREKSVDTLIAFLEEHPEVGLAGGLSENLDATPQSCFFRFPNAAREFTALCQLKAIGELCPGLLSTLPPANEPTQVDWVSGAFVAIRAEVLAQIGTFDESYFLYFEETDFILRARRAGWTCWHVPAARLVHLVGSSSGVTRPNERARRPGYWYESRSRFFSTNYGIGYSLFADVLSLLGYLLGETKRLLKRAPPTLPQRFARDLIRASMLFQSNREKIITRT